MMLTTRGRYAVTAMVDLAIAAERAERKPIRLADISTRQEIPVAYLEQIFAKLRRSGLVTSVRGANGGYRLGRAAAAIRVADIVVAAEEPLRMTRCGSGSPGCMADKARCLTHDLWEGLGEQILGYLESVTLADICRKQFGANTQATWQADEQAISAS